MSTSTDNEKCISVELFPSSTWGNGWYEQARAVMHFPSGKVKAIPYYDDEISFTEKELIGLTREQADELYCEKQGKADH